MPDILDDDELPRIKPKISPAAQNPMEIPTIASPQMSQMKPAVNLPGVQVPTQTQTDTNELNRLKTTGSGISQIHNPFLKTLATIGDVASNVISPGLSSRIPGTMAHHNQLVGQQEGIVKNDLGQAKEIADTAHQEAETKKLNNPQPQKAENPEADAYAVLNDPNSTPEQRKAATDALNTVKDAGKQDKGITDPKTGYAQAIAEAIKAGRDPNTDPHVQAWKTAIESIGKQEKPDAPEQQFVDEFMQRNKGATIAQAQRAYAQNSHVAESPDVKRNAVESAQVERESRQNIRKAADKYLDTKRSVAQLSASIDAAKDGNGLVTSFVPTMEVLGINASSGVHRISPAEAQAANLPGGWAEQFNAWYTKASSGKPTPQLIAEGKQLASILKKGAYQQYKDTHDYESGVVSGYGGKDFGKRVPLIPGEDPQPTQGPKVGDIVDGFKFKGGDPSVQTNWEKAGK